MDSRMHHERESLQQALLIQRRTSHTYDFDVDVDHCTGEAVQGGYLGSAAATAVTEHFLTTHKSLDQPHILDSYLVFLRPAGPGRISVVVHDEKLGMAVSTVHVSIQQGRRVCVTGVFSTGNVHLREDISPPHSFKLYPALPTAMKDQLAAHVAPLWDCHVYTHSDTDFYVPRSAADPSTVNMWITPTEPSATFTNQTIAKVADNWAPVVENHRFGRIFETTSLAEARRRNRQTPDNDVTVISKNATRSMTLSYHKELPPHGVRWLHMRAQLRGHAEGRRNAEVLIYDEHGTLVATSQQVISVPAQEEFVRASRL